MKKAKTKDPLLKLTITTIDKLQNYYGIAMRENANDFAGMQKAVRATLYHVASSDVNHNNSQCSAGALSWCKFNKDKVTGETTRKHGPGLPVEVINMLSPMYKELSSEELLSK